MESLQVPSRKPDACSVVAEWISRLLQPVNPSISDISKRVPTKFMSLIFKINSVGHTGRFGHEFLEFEFNPEGKLRYANNSNYKNDSMIRKEVSLNSIVMDELKRIILDSEIMREDDRLWPMPDKIGRQELEIIHGEEHIRFTV